MRFALGEQPHHTVAVNLPKAAAAGVRDAQDILNAIPKDARTRPGESWGATQGRIREWIEKQGGPKQAYDALLALKREWTPLETGVGQELMRWFASQKDNESLATLSRQVMRNVTDEGRMLNYMKTFQRETPEGFLLFLEKLALDAEVTLTQADRMDAQLLQRWMANGGLNEAELAQASPALHGWIAKTEPYVARGEIELDMIGTAKALDMVAQKQSAGFRQKFRALQRISMLSNPKTHIRNIIGNIMVAMGDALAEPIARGADKLLAKSTGQSTFSGGFLDTLKAFASGAGEGLTRARIDRATGIETMSGRYQEGIAGRGPAFDAAGAKTTAGRAVAGFFNSVDELIGYGLSIGDAWALFGGYRAAEMQMTKAAGLDAPTPEIIQAAWDSAFRKTFRDNNAITKSLEAVRNGAGVLGDIIAPYVRTPANVLKVSLEYSPIGFVEAISKCLFGKSSLAGLKARGESTLSLQRDIAELFGRGAVGTALMMLGMAAGAAGWVSGDDEENQKERAYQKAKGVLANSFRICDTYLDASSLQTLSVPLVAGGAVGAAMQGEAVDWTQLLSAAVRVGNTALEMPVLQGVEELFSGNYSEEGITLGLISLAADAVQQVIPFASLSRQAARALDPYARTTAEIDKEGLAKQIAESRNELLSIAPGLRERLPQRYDTLGEAVHNDASEGLGGRLFNAFLNPFNTSRAKETDVTAEIDRLYGETMDRSVLPRLAPYDVTQDGARYDLTSAERQSFQQAEGKTTNELLEAIFAAPEYQNAPLEQQVDMVMRALDYSSAGAKEAFLAARGVEYADGGWMQKVRELAAAGVSEAEGILYREALAGIEEEGEAAGLPKKDINRAKRDYLYSLPLAADKKAALDAAFIDDGKYIPEEYEVDYGDNERFLLTQMTETAREKWPKAQAWGMTAEEYNQYYPLVANSNKRKAERIADLVAAGMSEAQAAYFWKLINNK